jgi:hypothetical protein
MSIFKQKVSVSEILREIPEVEIARLASETRVDHYTKVLTGKLMFNLLLYGMLRVNRLSQRGLSDTFGSPFFRLLFGYRGKGSISHSSISERLSSMKVDFFIRVYESIYGRFSGLYTKAEIAGFSLQRVDSTLVKEVSGKLREGLTCGNDYGKGKMLKYTLNYDGMFASLGKVHSKESYASESLALPENVTEHFKKEKDHAGVYLFDRGQSSTESFGQMSRCKGLRFVGRLLENRKLHVLGLTQLEGVEALESFTQGELKQDVLVQLYKSVEVTGRKGKPVRKSVLVEDTLRVIDFIPPGGKTRIILVTNQMDLSADKIALMYRRRWDIEVFFRFLKQELNFSHFLSLDEKGIEVVLYMTMITAMPVMIYKKENEIGYKTAVRRIGIELEELILSLITVLSGGDLKKIESFIADT